MKNPTSFCPHCKKLHGNPVIELFNEFLLHCGARDLSEDEQMSIYRAYVGGHHDAVAMIIQITDYPESTAEDIVSKYAAAVRDALVAGIPAGNEELRAKVPKAVSARFYIPESGCSNAN